VAADDSAGEFVEFLRDQLRRWAPVTARRMFSGKGIYRGTVIFALFIGDTLYFRTDDENRGEFEALGMPPFRYERSGRTVALGYHEVPADVLEDTEELARWATRAYSAALRRAARQQPSRGKRRRRNPDCGRMIAGRDDAWRRTSTSRR
jgi:DNA transformation protein